MLIYSDGFGSEAIRGLLAAGEQVSAQVLKEMVGKVNPGNDGNLWLKSPSCWTHETFTWTCEWTLNAGKRLRDDGFN